MKKNVFLSLLLLTSCSLFEGPEGLKSLVDIVDEPSGINCSKGGLKITSGIDKNKNGSLDLEEVTTIKFLCSPENGKSSIVISNIETPGSNCSYGGVRIEVGKDLNADGQLSQIEIEQTRYICNGTNGLTSLVNSIIESPGSNCPYGGQKLEVGIDANGNGVLDFSEIKQVRYVCNGSDGTTDKEIRFSLGSFSNYSGTPPYEYPNIFDFDIRNYPMIDSAVFVIFGIGTYDFNGQPIVLDGTFRLFDASNGQAIANSSIVSDDIPSDQYKTSGNFIANLPRQKIKLRTDVLPSPNNNVQCSKSFLILVRK